MSCSRTAIVFRSWRADGGAPIHFFSLESTHIGIHFSFLLFSMAHLWIKNQISWVLHDHHCLWQQVRREPFLQLPVPCARSRNEVNSLFDIFLLESNSSTFALKTGSSLAYRSYPSKHCGRRMEAFLNKLFIWRTFGEKHEGISTVWCSVRECLTWGRLLEDFWRTICTAGCPFGQQLDGNWITFGRNMEGNQRPSIMFTRDSFSRLNAETYQDHLTFSPSPQKTLLYSFDFTPLARGILFCNSRSTCNLMFSSG